MEPNSDLAPRVGTFFILVAVTLMVMFVGSDLAKDPQFDLFFLGVAAAFFGYFLRRKAPKAAASGRFGILQKARAKRKERLEKKQQKKEQKKNKK
jgi:flagellar biosynthesis component FlhA